MLQFPTDMLVDRLTILIEFKRVSIVIIHFQLFRRIAGALPGIIKDDDRTDNSELKLCQYF